jgi:hypothetical protein
MEGVVVVAVILFVPLILLASGVHQEEVKIKEQNSILNPDSSLKNIDAIRVIAVRKEWDIIALLLQKIINEHTCCSINKPLFEENIRKIKDSTFFEIYDDTDDLIGIKRSSKMI